MISATIVLRQGFLPIWATCELEACLALLKADDPRLIQGSTSFPPPLMAAQDLPVERVDPVGFCSTPDALNCTVGEVEEGFARCCFEADARLGEPAACRWALNAIDDEPREKVWKWLIDEIEHALAERKATGHLPSELKTALTMFPDDTTLRQACADYLIEQGQDQEADAFR